MAGLPGLVTDVDRLMPEYVVELPHGGVQLATPATEGHRRRLVVGLALSATDALAALAAAEGASRVTVRAVFEETGGGMHILAIPVLACLIYGTLGLYGGYGPSPAERLRLRSLGRLHPGTRLFGVPGRKRRLPADAERHRGDGGAPAASRLLRRDRGAALPHPPRGMGGTDRDHRHGCRRGRPRAIPAGPARTRPQPGRFHREQRRGAEPGRSGRLADARHH